MRPGSLVTVDTNLRPIRRDAKGEAFSFNPDKPLCSMCAKHDTCRVRKRIEKQSCGALRVTHCKKYVAPLIFADQTGLDVPSCTMRLGAAWATRVRVNDPVALILKRDMRLIRIATVTATILLDRDEAIREHAINNHLFVGAGLTKVQAGKALAERMPKIVGSGFFRCAKQISVIYFA